MNSNNTKTKMENLFMTILHHLAVFQCLALIVPVYAQEHHHEDEDNVIKMTIDERISAGIVVDNVTFRRLNETVIVPGEVVINAYRSARVTPRINAQIVERHVTLGDRVEIGDRLLTLSSVAMAEAQGTLIVANREWLRVKSLGRETVSERRYTDAQVAFQQAFAKVLAYGMTQSQASALLQSDDVSKATGEFDLLAPQAGTVLRDDFIRGEIIEPGRVLVDISDESVIWVEAKTMQNGLHELNKGDVARVSLDGINWMDGTVIQRHHILDEITRTRGIRIEVDNADDSLHSGQFVEVEIVTGTHAPVLAVPSTALTLINGSTTVFKFENDNEFHPQQIDTGPSIGEWTVVTAGLSDGDQVAIDGVFHLKSLLLKSSLGEGHAH